MLRQRLNAQLAARPEKATVVIDVEGEEVAPAVTGDVEPVEASDARLTPSADLAHGPAPATVAPTPG